MSGEAVEFKEMETGESMADKLARMATPAPTPEEQAATTEVEAAETAKTELEAAAEATESEGGTASPEKKESPEPPPPKFETIEDYDKAYKAAVQKMTTATTEAATERKAREASEARLAEIEAARTAAETAADTARQELEKVQGKPISVERKEAFAAALKKIQAIPIGRNAETGEPEYPADYDAQVAEAWAATSVDPKEIAKEAAKLAREEMKAARAEEAAAAVEANKVTDAQRIRENAEKMAATNGLDMTPGSADYRLFYTFVNELAADPKHEYWDKPLDEQVKWASTGVRTALGKKIELTDAERTAALKHQEQNAVLGRGATPRVTPAAPRQRSMEEILAARRK